MNKYLIITALYRFLCGGLILAINWELANPESTKDLAISTVLSFVPAIFIPFIINSFLNNCSGSSITKLSFLLVFLIVLCIAYFYDYTLILIFLNFVIWIVFFLLETSLEFWFSELVAKENEEYINKYTSISMTVNQVALMVGPLVVSIVMNYIELYWIFIIYGLVYLFLYFSINSNKHTKCVDQLTNGLSNKEKIKLTHLVMSMLMWPILGTINFTLPTFTTFNNGQVYEVALLDSALGIGMACIGIILSKYLFNSWINLFFYISIMITIVWYFLNDNLIIKFLLMLLFGISFGGARIVFRKLIVTKYSSNTVKRVYSIGNAYSLLILSISIYIGVQNLSLVWLPSFILLIVLLLLLQFNIRKETLE